MYCELISAVVILVINIPLSVSLDYHFLVYSMHDPNQCVELRRCQETHNQLPHPMSHLYVNHSLWGNCRLWVEGVGRGLFVQTEASWNTVIFVPDDSVSLSSLSLSEASKVKFIGWCNLWANLTESTLRWECWSITSSVDFRKNFMAISRTCAVCRQPLWTRPMFLK